MFRIPTFRQFCNYFGSRLQGSNPGILPGKESMPGMELLRLWEKYGVGRGATGGFARNWTSRDSGSRGTGGKGNPGGSPFVLATLPADVIHLDLVFALFGEGGAFFGIAIGAASPHPANQQRQFVIRRARPQRSTQVMPFHAKQAGE